MCAEKEEEEVSPYYSVPLSAGGSPLWTVIHKWKGDPFGLSRPSVKEAEVEGNRFLGWGEKRQEE